MSGRETPLVSVVVRTLDRPAFLKDAVRSALEQTMNDREIVVVNDGGADVGDLLRSFGAGDAIRYVDAGRRLGRCRAGNLALEKARGKYVAYLADDDVYLPDHLDTLVRAVTDAGTAVAYTDAYCVRQRKDPGTGGYATVSRKVEFSRAFDPLRLFSETYIHLVSFFHERRCFERMGGFDESLPVLEDLDLFIRYAQDYPFAHVARPTAEFRIRDDGTNAVDAMRDVWAETREKLFRKHAHLVVTQVVSRFYALEDRLAKLEAGRP